MRISDLRPGAVEPAGGRPAEQARPDTQDPAPDQAELSRLAQQLAAAGVDEARIEELRRKVQSGEYEVPAIEIAGDIIKSHLDSQGE